MFSVIESPCARGEYNSLPDVVDADAALAKAGDTRDQLVQRGSALCHSTPFAFGEIGAFLLHRHWELAHGEWMTERPGRHTNGRPALVTGAEKARPCPEIAPSRLRVDPVRRRLVALEYSTDPFVVQVWNSLSAHTGLRNALCDEVADSGLADKVGLAIFARHTLTLGAGENIVEENWNQRSVLTAQSLPNDPDRVIIQTGWAFLSPGDDDPVASSCIKYCMGAGSSPHCSHHANMPTTLPPQMASPPVCLAEDAPTGIGRGND